MTAETTRGDFEVNLTINGEDILLSNVQIASLVVYEGVSQLLPTIDININDPILDRSLPPIYDGSLINVLLSPKTNQEDKRKQYSFRVYSYEINSSNTFQSIHITGYLDVPSYFKDLRFKSYNGSSNSVAKDIANQNSLTFDGDATSDKQKWLQSGIPDGQFLQHVVKHAYKDDTSCFVFAVTAERELLFVNLNDPARLVIDWEMVRVDSFLYPVAENQLPVFKFVWTSRSGFLNRFSASGLLAGAYDLTTGNLQDAKTDVRVKNTQYLSINSELQKESRYLSLPYSSDNVHENYNKARVQNLQMLGSYANNIRATTSRIRDVKLLDRVFLSVEDSPGTLALDYSGEYYVDRIMTGIVNNQFLVEYNLVREGINVLGSPQVSLL